MTFFQTIKNSIYGPDFYRELRSNKLSYSLKYFYILGIVVAVILTIFYSATVIPAASAFIRDLGPQIVETYPDGFEVYIKNGAVSTNAEEPYGIPLPSSFDDAVRGERDEREIENLVVFDTAESFSMEAFQEYKTMVLVSNNTIAFADKNGSVKIQPLDGAGDVTITKNLFVSLVGKLQSLTKYLAPVIVFLIFFGMLIVYTFHLVYALAAGFIVWLVLKVVKKSAAYSYVFRALLHALTLPILAALLLQLVLPGARIPFLFTVLFVVSIFMNKLFKNDAGMPPVEPVPQTPAAGV